MLTKANYMVDSQWEVMLERQGSSIALYMLNAEDPDAVQARWDITEGGWVDGGVAKVAADIVQLATGTPAAGISETRDLRRLLEMMQD